MDRKERLLKAKNFSIYYGMDRGEQLSAYDIAIVEHSGQKDITIKNMQESGTLTFAYLSGVEINASSPLYTLLEEEDFLKIDGKRVMNEAYGNYMVDIQSKRWVNLLVHQAGRLLLKYHYDGIFIDTLGNLEMPSLTRAYGSQLLQSAAFFLSQIKRLFPEHLLIQNNVIENLCSYTMPWIDGVCWENPPFQRMETFLSMKALVENFATLQECNKKVMVVAEMPEVEDLNEAENRLQGAKEIASNNHFLFYAAPPNYLGTVTGISITQVE